MRVSNRRSMPIVGSTFAAGSGSPGVNSGRRHAQGLAADLGIPGAKLSGMLNNRFFGAAWAEIEANSPFLVRRRVRFTDLPRQIAYARQLLEEDAVPDAIFT